MRLLFTGTTSIWLILLMLIAACAYTILIYRQHDLPRPWRFWLPTMRIVALFLLILTLLQPVISRVWKINIRGKIPVIVDNSGSMSIKDSYSPANIVNIGWNFKLYPQSLRNTVFTEERKNIEDINRQLTKIIVDKSNPGKHAVSELREKLQDAMKEIESSIKDTDYLKKTVPKKSSYRKGLKKGITFMRYDKVNSTSLPDFKKVVYSGKAPSKYIPAKSLDLKNQNIDFYGVVARGYISPPKTATYHFAASADDYLEFYLSKDSNPKNKQLGALLKSGHHIENLMFIPANTVNR